MDAMLKQKRRHGASWKEISEDVGVYVEGCIKRAKELGINTSARLSSGNFSGQDVAQGKVPKERQIRYPYKLGKIWKAIIPEANS